MPWLPDWSKRIELEIDGSKIDEDLTDFPLMIALASGTGRTNTDTTDVFDELSLTSSGTIDSYTKLLLHGEGDSSANHHSLQFVNGMSIAGNQKFGGGLDFPGSSRVEIDDHEDWNLADGEFTIDFWINVSSGATGNFIPIAHSDYAAGGSWMFWHGSSLGLSFGYYTSGNSTFQNIINYAWNPSTSTWYHLAVSKDSSDMYRLFIDGDVVASGTNATTLPNGTQSLVLGCQRWNGSFYNYIDAYLDEVRISKGIARWTNDFTVSSEPYEPDSYTKLLIHGDGDLSANEHTMAIASASYLQTDYNGIRKFDGSFRFGGNSYMYSTDHADWDFGTDDFTIEFWINTTQTTAYACLIGRYQGAPPWGLYLTATGEIYFYNPSDNVTSDGSVNDGYWHHVAVIREGDYLKFYIDGILDTVDSGWDSRDLTAASNLHIGFDSANPYFVGYLSEIRISKGIARWDKNFVPPTRAYPDEPEIVDYYPKRLSIADNTNTQSYVEIENWNPYTKEATLWTNIATLSGINTKYYLYYDVTQPNNTTYVGYTGDLPVPSIWDNNFDLVYHMAQDPSGGSGCILDSTSNNNNGTPGGSMDGLDLITGKHGSAIDFDGNNDFITIGNLYSSPQASGTIEVVFRSADTIGTFISQDTSGWNNLDTVFGLGQQNVIVVPNGYISFETHGPGTSQQRGVDSGTTYNNNEWHSTIITWNSVKYELFVDGLSKDVEITSYGAWGSDGSTNIEIGRRITSNYYSGALCEVRISNIPRSTAWLKATYYSGWNDLVTFGAPDSTGPAVLAMSGHVYEVGNPVSRIVRAYRRDTGELVDETTSNSSTGYYYLNTTYSGTHSLVCLDAEGGESYNDLIIGQATASGIGA